MTAEAESVTGEGSRKITIVDVSVRDGLQTQNIMVPPEVRAQWLRELFCAGVAEAESGSFVNVRRVPQMEGAAKVLELLEPYLDRLWALVPNLRGLEDAINAGARNVLCLVSTNDAHSLANQGRPVCDILAGLKEILRDAKAAGVRSRVAIAMAWVDPVEGVIPARKVVEISEKLRQYGCEEITLCDTSGLATAESIARLIREVEAVFPVERMGLHLHEVYGPGMANILSGLLMGITRFDASLNGLGGCPVVAGAPGNIDIRKLAELFDALKIEIGMDLERLKQVESHCIQYLSTHP